jgi:hypothetical protein
MDELYIGWMWGFYDGRIWWIGSLALRIIGVVVPSEVVAGRDALLQCHYDLEGSSLYALKWYKGSHGKRFGPPYTDTNHNQLFDDEFVSLFSSPAIRLGTICRRPSRTDGPQNSIGSSWKKCRPSRLSPGPASPFTMQVIHPFLFWFHFFLNSARSRSDRV